MSDLFKKNAPRLSEDEEQRLWQRVRAIPDEVAAERASQPEASPARDSRGTRPWWRGLFAAPAFRYGAPALAVVVAATLYVLQQSPRAPVPGRETTATRATGPAVEQVVPSEEAAPMATAPDAAMPAPESPPTEGETRARVGAPASPDVATQSAPSSPSTPSAQDSRAGLGATANAPSLVLEKKQGADRDAGNFAAPPPAVAPSPQPPSKVTVLKGGNSTAPEPAPAQRKEANAKDDVRVEEQRELSQLGADESPAAGAPADESTLDAKGERAAKSMYRLDSPTSGSPWQAIVAGSMSRSRIEVIPSLFDDGGVVVLAGAAEAGLGLLVDGAIAAQAASRATRLVRDAATGRWGAAAWVYDRTPDALSPVVVRPDADSPSAVRGFTTTRRASFRDAPDDVQIAYLAAEGERTSAISADTSARTRFDRLLTEANRVAARHPTDARVVRLVQLLTGGRATLR